MEKKTTGKPLEQDQQRQQMTMQETGLSVQEANAVVIQLRKMVESLKSERQDIAVLGDGQVFLRRKEDGNIKAVSGAITLSEKKGQLADIQGKFMITNEGYLALNKIANVSLITPKTLDLPDGKTVINPCPFLDEKLGYIKKVWVKKIAIGFSPIGNLVMTSATLMYDPFMYFMQDLIKKIKFNKNCGRVCTEQMLTEAERKTGTFFATVGNMGMWGNPEDKDFLTCYETFIQSTLFAERKAVTICERNALRKHPALSQGYVEAKGPEKNHAARVGIIGYMNDLTREDLDRMAIEAEKGGNIKYKGNDVIMIESDAETASEDDFVVEREDDEEKPEEQDESVQENQEPESEHTDDAKELQDIAGKLQKAISIIGEEQAKKIAADNFGTTIEKLKPKQLEQLNKLIAMEMDKEAAL
ncbi:MAG: hypothetical protein WC998_04355 [Candidatus Paceibacterota bacterium]|jgi:hypothetical protein